MISGRTIGRLSLYRSLLLGLPPDKGPYIYSHELARMAGATPVLVRRDIMALGQSGSPRRGYVISQLIAGIGNLLDSPQPQSAALVGMGNLGRAIATYFVGRRQRLTIAAAFDKDPEKIGRVISGCPCHSIADMPRIIREKDIRVAIITVPAGWAQGVADMLVRAGVTGILNFAPVRLRVPFGVHLEDMDVTVSLEKAAYFARKGTASRDAAEAPVDNSAS